MPVRLAEFSPVFRRTKMTIGHRQFNGFPFDNRSDGVVALMIQRSRPSGYYCNNTAPTTVGPRCRTRRSINDRRRNIYRRNVTERSGCVCVYEVDGTSLRIFPRTLRRRVRLYISSEFLYESHVRFVADSSRARNKRSYNDSPSACFRAPTSRRPVRERYDHSTWPRFRHRVAFGKTNSLTRARRFSTAVVVYRSRTN